MSQSSETTTTSDFDLLGYPCSEYSNGYYTAQARPGIGVCIATMQNGTMVQFFPWSETYEVDHSLPQGGHSKYAKFITAKSSELMAENGDLFDKWPFVHTDSNELLIIKCLVEDGLNQVEKYLEIQRSGTDPTAGEAVE